MLNRERLEYLLNGYFDANAHNADTVDRFSKLINKNHNMPYSRAKSVFLGTIGFEELTDEEVYWIADAAQNFSIPAETVNIDDYYSPLEKSQYCNTQYEDKKKSKYPVEFNVSPVGNGYNQWVGVVTADQLYALDQAHIIYYNIKTQRNPIVRYNKAGEEQLEINVNKNSVNAIRSLMQRNLFIPNAITLNIKADDDDVDFDYDFHNGVLRLNSGKVDIIDGYHRYQAIIREKLENPSFQYDMILFITYFDTATAKRFIAQENKRNKINSEYAKSLDDTNYGTIIVTNMNSNNRFMLNGMIKPYKTPQDNFTIGRAATAIDDAFSILNIRDAKKVEKYLIDGINDIIDVSDELIKNDKDLRIAIFTLSIMQNLDMEQEEKIRIAADILKHFNIKYKYDAGKAFPTVKKIIQKMIAEESK